MVPPEEKETKDSDAQTNQNKKGMLCYAGFWVTGIIFLIIEKKNKLVRFHAMQSLVTFGILNIIWGIANTFRWAAWTFTGGFGFSYAQWLAGSIVFGIFFAIWWILWAILMYRTYKGRMYRVPWFGNIAEKCLNKLDEKK